MNKTETLAHYTAQAALAGDAAHVANLIRHARYTAQDLALLISALCVHAAHLDKEGMDRFGEVSALLDDAADIAEDSYFVPELAR